MNILNLRQTLVKDQFSYFKINSIGYVTGYDAINLPDGMDIYKPDGYIYGTPTKQQTKSSVFLAKSRDENIYKIIEIQVVENSEINLSIPNSINSLSNKITALKYPSGQAVNVNLNNILSGYYEENIDKLNGILTYGTTGVTFYNVNKNVGYNKIYSYGNASISGDNLTGVVSISAGENHALALFYNRTISGWGDNTYNKASLGNILTGVTGISAGSGHSLAVLINNTVTGWGNNENQQVSGTSINTTWNLTPPGRLTNVSKVSAGGIHSIALLINGKITGWGDNTYGQVSGTTSYVSNWSSTPVGILSNVTQISAGREHTLALFSNGKLTGWGNNNYGQVAGVTSFSNWSGTPASILTGVRKVSAGNYHSIALLDDGLITGWGNNDYGQSISNLCIKTGNNKEGINDCISIDLNCSPAGFQVQDGFDSLGCPKYKCAPCNPAPNCGPESFGANITGYNSNGCPEYQCVDCGIFPCTGSSSPEAFRKFLVINGVGQIGLSLSPVNNWVRQTPELAWGDVIPIAYAPMENVPLSIIGTKNPWTLNHTYDGQLIVITPENISVRKDLIGYQENGCPIYGPCNYTVLLQNRNAVNLRNELPYATDLQSEIIFNIIGNLGADTNQPAIDTGGFPTGTTIKINVPPIVGSNPCNPTAGVVAGRGGASRIANTPAIIVRNGINLIIKNDGKIGSGGPQGADNPCCCGEGGPGAGIPANGGSCGGCCGGEGAATILCGGNGAGGSSAGAGLGGQPSWIDNNRPRAAPCIVLYPGATYSFDPASKNPFFEGLALVSYV